MFDIIKFKIMLLEKNYSYEKLARDLSMNKSTLVRKLKEGGNFCLKNFEIMFSVFGREKVIEVFFPKDKVA